MVESDKALTPFLVSDLLPDLTDEDMALALQDHEDESVSLSGAVTYLSFSGKTGSYSLGRNKDDVDPEELFLLEPKSFIEGWICWKSNKPVGRIEWSLYQRKAQAVAKDDLEDFGPYRKNMGEGWRPLLGFGVVTTDGQATPIKFTASSTSACNSISDMFKQARQRMQVSEPSMPIISFDSEPFTAQEQTNQKPVFLVESWVTRAAAAAYFDGSLELDELIEGKAPKKKRARTKKK